MTANNRYERTYPLRLPTAISATHPTGETNDTPSDQPTSARWQRSGAAYSPATDNGRKRGLDSHYRAETRGGTLQTAQPGQHHGQTPADNPVHRRTRLSVLSIEDMKEEGSKQQERRPDGTKDTGERANVISLSPVFPAVRRQRTCDALLNRLNDFEILGPIRSLVVFNRSCRNFQYTGFVHERKMCHIAERTIQLRQGGRGTLCGR